MQDERELNVELDPERGGEEIVPVRVASDELKPDTLRAVIESFVLRGNRLWPARDVARGQGRAGVDPTATRRGAYHV